MIALRALKAQLFKRAIPEGTANSSGGIFVTKVEDADGVLFNCPQCFREGNYKCADIFIWFDGKQAFGNGPSFIFSKATGKTIDDLSLEGVLSTKSQNLPHDVQFTVENGHLVTQ